MVKEITAILIVFPFLAALCCYVLRSSTVRSFIVLTTGGVLAASAIFLIPMTPFSIAAPALPGPGIHAIVRILDFLLLFIILYFGFKHHSLVIIALAAFQIVLLAYFEFFLISGEAAVTTI